MIVKNVICCLDQCIPAETKRSKTSRRLRDEVILTDLETMNLHSQKSAGDPHRGKLV